MVASTDARNIESYRGSPIIHVTQRDTGRNLVFAKPATSMFEKGIATSEIREVNSQGYETTVGQKIDALTPKGTLNFTRNNLDITALQEGKNVLTRLASVELPFRMQVQKAEYLGAPVGKVGYGVTIDAETNAWYQDVMGGDVKLTQQSFSSFNSNIQESFAIGPNFARKFSNDIIGKYIALTVPYSAETRELSEEDIGILEIRGIQFYTTSDRLDLVYVPYAIVDPAGAKYDPKEANVTVNLRLLTPSGCQPYYVNQIPAGSFCEN